MICIDPDSTLPCTAGNASQGAHAEVFGPHLKCLVATEGRSLLYLQGELARPDLDTWCRALCIGLYGGVEVG